MSKTIIYTGIKTALTDLSYTKTDGSTDYVKTIALWRNQLERESEEIPFLYPAVFVEFLTSNYMEGSSKAYQTMEMTVRLHICFESYLTEDLDILILCQQIYSALQLKSFYSTTMHCGTMKRRSEEQNFDHPNIQDFIQSYDVSQSKDYGADARPSTDTTVGTLIITPEIHKTL